AILLHGAAVAYVYIALQLEVDRFAGPKLRASAQGLLVVAMQGFGCFAGAELAGLAGGDWLTDQTGPAAAAGWQSFWSAPAWGAAAVLAIVQAVLPADPA